MRFKKFSPQQRRVLQWWREGSPDRGRDAIICDGAVRSGKTACLCLSFFCWAMCGFEGESFALCAKTVKNARRNLLGELAPVLRQLGFSYREKPAQNLVEVSAGGRRNTFYLFGGKDESSAALVQGMTLAGVLLDEVVLMPRSFVEQALARCSVPGSKIWFSCNPAGPGHWFYKEWVQKAEEKKALYLHFTMDDNPGLTEGVKARFKRLFRGTFYRRFVLGEWVAAEGAVYDFFDESYVRPVPHGGFDAWRISCDYGTVNPTSMGLWGRRGEIWYRTAEYFYDSRAEGAQKTDREYADALARLAGEREIEAVIVDPSAASFIEVLRRDGWPVRKGDNDVLAGIRVTGTLLKEGKIVICDTCHAALEEFYEYRWQEAEGGQDRVRKEHDHAMDEMRYFAMTVEVREDGFAGWSVARG